ncbi:MAG: acetate--CoA ligase family protein [Candidatus Njordarchaeales archaeon]
MNYKEGLLYKEITPEVLDQYSSMVRQQLEPFFEPRSIAVIGASRDVNSPGWVIFKNLLENKAKGWLKANVYGVNIKGGELFGQLLYRSILEVPDDVDHAVIVIPAKYVPSALEECGKKNVKVASIISAGFSEIGNVELEKRVVDIAKNYGIRIIGPNGLGVFDAYSGVDTMFLPYNKPLNGEEILATPRPKKGYIMFISQSGALGVSVLDYMYGEGIGISKFISYGNKVDVDEVDMLLYALKDDSVRVVMIYIEGIKGDGRPFVKIGKEFSKHKPIVVLKGGRTRAGARAAMSHTASLAGNVRIYQVAFETMGAIVADDLVEFLDVTKALAFQPPAQGENIAIVTNGGGAGILAADKAEKVRLNVIPTPEKLLEKLKKAQEEDKIPSVATFSNPIDLSGSAFNESYTAAVEAVMEDDNIHAVLIIGLHHVPLLTSSFVDEIAKIVKKYKKPVVAVDIGGADMANWVRDRFDSHGIPAYPTPERGIVALKALVKYGLWLKKEGVLEEYLERWRPPATS